MDEIVIIVDQQNEKQLREAAERMGISVQLIKDAIRAVQNQQTSISAQNAEELASILRDVEKSFQETEERHETEILDTARFERQQRLEVFSVHFKQRPLQLESSYG